MKKKIFKIIISVILTIIIIANSIVTTALSIVSGILDNEGITLLGNEVTSSNIYGKPSGYALKGNDGGIVIYRIYKESENFNHYNLLCVNHGKHISYNKLTSGDSIYKNETTRNTVFSTGNVNKALWLLDNIYVAENINDETKNAMKDNLKEIMKMNTSYSEADINSLIDSICVDYVQEEGNQYYEIYSILQILLWQYTNNEGAVYEIDDNHKLYKWSTGKTTVIDSYTQEVTGNYKWLYETLKTIADSKENYISPNINENGMKSELDKIKLTNGNVDVANGSVTFNIESGSYSFFDLSAGENYEVQIDNSTIGTDKYTANVDGNKLTIKMNDNSGINLTGKTVKVKMNIKGIATDGYYITTSEEDIQNLISLDKRVVTASIEGIAESNISGNYHMNIVKKSANDDSELSDKTTALGGTTFKVTKTKYGKNTEEKTVTTENGKEVKNVFEVDIEEEGIGLNKQDIFTIEETGVTSGFKAIDLSDISIHVYKKEHNEKYIIDYVKINKGDKELAQANSCQDKSGEAKIDINEDGIYDLGLEVSVDGMEFCITVRNPQKEGKYSVKLIKTDSNGNALTKSETKFKINEIEIETLQGELQIVSEKEITKAGQKDEYLIEESVAPKGYNLYKGKINLLVEGKESESGYEVDEQNTKLTVNGEELKQNTESKDGYVSWNKSGNTIIIKVKNEYPDLALRKFITKVNNEEITNRIPNVDITPLVDKTATTAKYTHLKDPVLVHTTDIVTYTIRVYNEGTMDAYASLIKDDIPQGLEFVQYIEGDGSTNDIYKWKLVDENDNEVTDVTKAKYIVTNYLAIDEEGKNLLKGFNPETMTKLDYRDVKVEFKVKEPNTSDRIIINQAQIAKDSDSNGNPITDRDSTPNKWKGEDDEDIEKIKVLYFDLALRKWVTQAIVTENGQTQITETGHKAEDNPEDIVKVDLKKSKINDVTVKFKYSIRITNEGEIAGEATEIRDDIPKGLKFVAEDNPDWKEENGQIVTNKLAGTTLQPGESAEVEIILTWVNSKENMGVMINTAEINKDHNEYGTTDIDSTPGNKVPREDDIDDAPVMITVKTGSEYLKYMTLTLGVFAILGLGISLIKYEFKRII